MVKIILAVLLSIFAITSYADIQDDDGSGYYLGFNLGYADRHLNENSFFASNNTQTVTGSSTTGMAGRVSAGYAFNPNFALEFGGTYLPTATANAVSNNQNINIKSTAYLIDLLFRGSLQFQHNFAGYFKIGMAYAGSNISYTGQSDSKAQVYYPAGALGVAYSITQELSLNVEWYHLFNNNNAYSGYAQRAQVINGGSYTRMPEIDMATLGIAYRF